MKVVLEEGASTAYIMASSAGGCGMKCHEASYESIFMMFTRHMPSLTESAGKVICIKEGVRKITELIFTPNLFDLQHFFAREIFNDVKYVWEIIPRIKDDISKLISTLPADFEQIEESVWVGKGTIIDPSVQIKGPAIIGYDCQIRHCAYIRENVIVGNAVVIGNSSEIKNSLLFDETAIPHFNYVGDSVLGYKSHLGAGVILSNLKSSKDEIKIKGLNGESYNTGLIKLGAFIGDKVEVGCNTVLNPGTIVGPESIIYPLSTVRGIIPSKCILKGDGKIIP